MKPEPMAEVTATISSRILVMSMVPRLRRGTKCGH